MSAKWGGVMPQDVQFALPFALGVSPDLDDCRWRNLAWVREYRLCTGAEALAWYAMWDMPRLAAYGFPYATGDELDLCADAMAFFFLFDDQFDGPLGSRPHHVAAVCRRLIGVVHGDRPGSSADPCTIAFAEVWDRCRTRASPGWQARAAGEWEYYFAAHAHEAVSRRRGTPACMQEYLQVRRGVAATDLPISLGERAALIDVPPEAFHSPQLRIMRTLAIDITFMCNDVYSLEKEEARGDKDNLVLVIEHEASLDRPAAIERARQEVARRCARFQDLARQVDAMCGHVGLAEAEQDAVRAYVGIMSSWIRGYHEWETETLRYATATTMLPGSAPGFFESLISHTELADD
jgi:pentalenene synthase/avermitilol synthase